MTGQLQSSHKNDECRTQVLQLLITTHIQSFQEGQGHFWMMVTLEYCTLGLWGLLYELGTTVVLEIVTYGAPIPANLSQSRLPAQHRDPDLAPT